MLKPLDGRLRALVMTSVTAVLALAGGAATDALALPRDGTGWVGLALVTVFYCIALSLLFVVLPKLPPTSSVALNFEPIALLAPRVDLPRPGGDVRADRRRVRHRGRDRLDGADEEVAQAPAGLAASGPLPK